MLRNRKRENSVSVSLEHSQHILRTGVSGEGGDLDDDDDDHDTHILKTQVLTGFKLAENTHTKSV